MTPLTQIYSVVIKELDPPFEKGCYVLLRQLRWVLGGKLGMVEELDSRRSIGLLTVAWLYIIGRFTPL
jgi:hypothetical protein